jgi:hypothetical protein
MADPQKLQKLVAETVSARLGQLQQSLTDEIASALQGMLSAAEEKILAAEEHAHELEDKLATAHERIATAEAELAEEKAKPAAPVYAPGAGPTDLLNATLASVADAGGQAEILKATLDGIAHFAPRTALYVVKAGQLTGWQSRGFENEGAIKGSTMSPEGLAARAMNDREPVSAAAAEFSSNFVGTHGNPSDGNATVLPLVVREKVSALIYVDGGATGKADISAVRVLVRSAAMWLEILALRKVSGSPAEAESAAEATPVPRASAAAASAPGPVPVQVALEPAPAAASATAAPAVAPGDEEVHKKAKRFAKLLVDEIKLYNQKKVEEGKKNKDLYTRLKEDIDKSRQTYDKRWGSSAAATANYFQAELVRILADDDTSLMGAGF